MSDTVRERMEDILEEMEHLEQIVEEQNVLLAQKNDFIDDLTSPRWYVEVAVACLLSYLYGAWLGVYMCPK
jgi:tetrahydromethanopterin S-methyltransferase subunit B